MPASGSADDAMPPRRIPPPETVAVREGHRFPTAALEEMLGERLGARLTGMLQMGGGQSNPTFVLQTDKGEFVLRKQPPGRLLPSAHAVDREFRVLSALAGTDVPVPRTHFFCNDPKVIGTPFYVMERLRGRVFWSPTLPEVPREDRRAIHFGMADALARLHRVDYSAAGLSDYGKPGSYFTRQIARWSKQWEASRTRENRAIDLLAEWLPGNIPEGDDETAICHGDFRLDNMMFDAKEPRVIGIFDWELSTLGHPLADLAYACIRFHLPPDVYDGLMGLDLAGLGLPGQEEFIAAYSEVIGKPAMITPFHLAFSLFRIAVIIEGIVARAKAGNASNDKAMQMAPMGLKLAGRGWEIAQG
jgi:aminoglycoside phosphotransferase (APT) family kinase protein